MKVRYLLSLCSPRRGLTLLAFLTLRRNASSTRNLPTPFTSATVPFASLARIISSNTTRESSRRSVGLGTAMALHQGFGELARGRSDDIGTRGGRWQGRVGEGRRERTRWVIDGVLSE